MYYLLFFFKQKTAYEMRISDWSSDVCSSDLSVLSKGGYRERAALIADGHQLSVLVDQDVRPFRHRGAGQSGDEGKSAEPAPAPLPKADPKAAEGERGHAPIGSGGNREDGARPAGRRLRPRYARKRVE